MNNQQANEEIELQNLSNGIPAPEEMTGMDSSERYDQARTTSSSAFSRFQHRVQIDVPLEACRDHLALERTYLAYFRTASALAIFGVSLTQLFRLKDISRISSHDSELFDYGKSVGIAMETIAVLTVLLGAFRWQKQQRRLGKHKIQGGGWEIWIVFGMLVLVSLRLCLRRSRSSNILRLCRPYC
jgi:uncharacterized membrane protein YidH (DUF202 family)